MVQNEHMEPVVSASFAAGRLDMRPVERPGTENPFNELYLSETIGDLALYSEWFSPAVLTGETESLFRRENTVLRGSNGAGKTMLLRLLSPQVQSKYLEKPGDFPLPRGLASTIGVNVNFLHAGFGALGKRRVSRQQSANEQEWAFLFADLLNYYIVGNLLKTLRFLGADGAGVAAQLNAELELPRLDRFARALAEHPCWFGGLNRVSDFQSLENVIRERIEGYRLFVNWNRTTLSTKIRRTKTSIGRPIIAAKEALTASGVFANGIALIVTLDQYESVYSVDYGTNDAAGPAMGRNFCRVVNSLLALRRPAVFFKIGVRHYAWGRELRGLNTDQCVERKRDYELIDLDDVLRRSENSGNWIFPRFAADVAARRIAATRGGKSEDYANWFVKRLQKLDPEQELSKYGKAHTGRRRPGEAARWPEEWEAMLEALGAKSRYQAKLAEVWIHQKAGGPSGLPEELPVSDETAPWNREYWRKERREALLTQIASDCQQRKLYAGWDTLLTLSGANILVFISLCREIWDQWQRAQSKTKERLEHVSADIQSQAVRTVASAWLEKQEEFPRGRTRQRFVERLGIGIRKGLKEDRGLSYPGHTGFSLKDEGWKADDVVRTFLQGAEDYGALIGLEHTSKEGDKRKRRKWYLSPILCPNFEIPAIRTKEPYYAQLQEVKTWIEMERPIVLRRGSRSRTRAADARTLFGQ